ncbi:MAG: hypothetical protein GY853_15730 [PVC group bacterium]|nr:hypothetical protein [PVC group bacterium]
MVEYTSDGSGRWKKTVYSKSFISQIVTIGEGLNIAITGFDEQKVNPFAAALGALGPKTTNPPASFVIHLRNNSQEIISVDLLFLTVGGERHRISPKKIVLYPKETKDCEKIMGSYSKWGAVDGIRTEIDLLYQSKMLTKVLTLNRETVKEFKRRIRNK